MKRLLISATALGLLTAGAAFAQDSGIGSPASTAGQPAPATAPMPAKPADAVRSPAITPQSTGTTAPAIVDTGTGAPPPATDTASPAAPAAVAPLAAATTTPAPATGEVVGDMTAANPPPAAGTYPACTRKGQDRCVVTAQLHHKAMKSAARTGF